MVHSGFIARLSFIAVVSCAAITENPPSIEDEKEAAVREVQATIQTLPLTSNNRFMIAQFESAQDPESKAVAAMKLKIGLKMLTLNETEDVKLLVVQSLKNKMNSFEGLKDFYKLLTTE